MRSVSPPEPADAVADRVGRGEGGAARAFALVAAEIQSELPRFEGNRFFRVPTASWVRASLVER